MKEKVCYVCLRIPSALVLEYAQNLWGHIDSRLAKRIGGEACRIIRRAYHEKPWFFCGKRKKHILSGLFYLLGWKYDMWSRDIRKTMFEIAYTLETTEITIRKSYRNWLHHFPWLYDLVGTRLKEVGLPRTAGRPRNGKAPNQIRKKWRERKKKLKQFIMQKMVKKVE